MDEQQKSPEEQRRLEEQRRVEEQRIASEQRAPRHIPRRTAGEQPQEETKTYVVKEGQTWGTNPELQAGDTVELTEAEAAGFEDKLEPVDGSGGMAEGRATPFQPPPPLDSTSKPSVPRRSG